MLLLTLRDFHKLHEKINKTSAPFMKLHAGLNKTGWTCSDGFIYICPYMKMDRIEICPQCNDRFICFTNKWGLDENS